MSALQKATDFIMQGLKNQVWRDGGRLPSIMELAAAAGVSKVTMSNAIRTLSRSRIVTVKSGSGIYAGKSGRKDVSNQPQVSSHSVEAKRIIFEHDLLKGIFASGRPLPSFGELQGRYGVSYRTMRKILNALATERILISVKKKFYLPHTEDRANRDTVCLLWEGVVDGSASRPAREGRILESLQRECALANTVLSFQGFETGGRSLVDSIRAQIENRESIIGYVIRPLSYHEPSDMARYVDLLLYMALEKKPIAIWDEQSLFTLPKPLDTNRLIKVFGIAGTSAGRDIGRMLLSLGHQRVAYLTDYRNELWSQRRYEGLLTEFKRAGHGDSVQLFSMENPRDLIDALLNPTGASPRRPHQLFPGLPIDSGETRALKERFAHLMDIVHVHEHAIRTFQLNMRTLLQIPEKNIYQKTRNYAVSQGTDWLILELSRLLAGYIFKLALADGSATAWVAANDGTAVFACDYVRSRNKRVPQDLSIVGFDGDPFGFENGITSYDFDFFAVARQTLSFIARPLATTRFTRGNHVELPGFIIRRASTGKAHRP